MWLRMSGHEEASTKAALKRIERSQEQLAVELRGYITAHGTKHDTDQQAYNQHLIDSSRTASEAARADVNVTALDKRVDSLELWRYELLGMGRLARLAFGTSVLSSLAAVVGIWVALSK